MPTITKDLYNALRATLFIFFIFMAVLLCVIEKDMETTPHEESPEAPAVETVAPAPQKITAPPSKDQPQTEKTVSEPPAAPEEPQKQEPAEEWTSLGTFTLTAYCPCERCCGYWATVRPRDDNGNPIIYTASGAIASAGTTIAVDPDVIPYGSTVKINDHIYIAQDTGGAINGSRIDVYHASHDAALQFGRQEAEVFILESR